MIKKQVLYAADVDAILQLTDLLSKVESSSKREDITLAVSTYAALVIKKPTTVETSRDNIEQVKAKLYSDIKSVLQDAQTNIKSVLYHSYGVKM